MRLPFVVMPTTEVQNGSIRTSQAFPKGQEVPGTPNCTS